ncbi:hypothetical protein B0E33_15020 [Roseibium algicola]|uniref:Tyr recombinase domain-containing protein n=1 Tax=Roseibium algicola TaxID=2857014 RepID=A0ABN4WWA1_9HYPH|nr:tyrosine-type recombinase/integrase [Roseibium aggregatum]AQQ04715.1 hypothetical protein B0E33_15020 [Roseibium aggregatum]
MSRRAKGPRLQFRKSRYDKKGKLLERGKYIIRDGDRYVSTGCFEGEIEKAEGKLAEYIIAKQRRQHVVNAGIKNTEISRVLAYYYSVKRPKHLKRHELDYTIETLNDYWGDKIIAYITPATCREYADLREGKSARNLLCILRAAVNLHEHDGLHEGSVKFFLPDPHQPRERYLTRNEAARLLWYCWRHRAKQARHKNRPGCEKVETNSYPLRHLVRVILIGLYTGSRTGAIFAASPYRAPGHAYVDLEHGIFYRLPYGKKKTKKRQPPNPIPRRLFAHMKRWHSKGLMNTHFVEFAGRPIRTSVKRAFGNATAATGLDDLIPHTLRHTCVTWLLQNGVSTWDTGGFVGMSAQMVEKVYGHHCPDHLKNAIDAFNHRSAK